jgi:hypothetical protein
VAEWEAIQVELDYDSPAMGRLSIHDRGFLARAMGLMATRPKEDCVEEDAIEE